MLEESILDLRIDLVKPLPSTVSLVSVTVFGGPELMRKVAGHLQSVPAVFFRHASRFVKQTKDGLPGLI
jgi:hypothetical protein